MREPKHRIPNHNELTEQAQTTTTTHYQSNKPKHPPQQRKLLTKKLHRRMKMQYDFFSINDKKDK